MKLTNFSDYTMRVLIYLALEPDRLSTIESMAKSYEISENHLMKVVNHLARSGLVESVRGKGGGVRLAKPARDIRLGDVVRNAEKQRSLVACMSDRAWCCISDECCMVELFQTALDAFYDTLNRHTLDEIVAQPHRQPMLCRLKQTDEKAGKL